MYKGGVISTVLTFSLKPLISNALSSVHYRSDKDRIFDIKRRLRKNSNILDNSFDYFGYSN